MDSYFSWCSKPVDLETLHPVDVPDKYLSDDPTSDHPQCLISNDLQLDQAEGVEIQYKQRHDMGGGYFEAWKVTVWFTTVERALEFKLKL